ncbi:hypothetical protein SCANM63S_08667 [Streptomyces canarius]
MSTVAAESGASARTRPSGSTTRLRPVPTGPAVLTLTTKTWLTMALARASTSSWARSAVVVITGLTITSAPSQASWRATSGNQAS